LNRYESGGQRRTAFMTAIVLFHKIIFMAQGKYLRLSHFVPKGHQQVHPGSSTETKEMMPFLVENTSRRWTKIPNRDLEVFAIQRMEVPCLAFRKNGTEVYLHIFCNEFMNPLYAMQMVIDRYTKFKFGKPVFIPEEPNWIHTIPLPGADLSAAETLLIHQITQSLFWTIYMDYKRIKGA
jgi:hypothetical protein